MNRFRRRSDGAIVLDEEERESGRHIYLGGNALRRQFSLRPARCVPGWASRFD